MLSRYPEKHRVAVSLKGTITQFIQSSSTPISERLVKDTIILISHCSPWFVQIIKLNGDGCMSSQSSNHRQQQQKGEENGDNEKRKNIDDDLARRGLKGGKENNNSGVKGVEGILIFAKRDGRFIGREEVLKEFRLKRIDWESSQRI